MLGLTSLVEIRHHNILRTPAILGASTQQPMRGISGLVYKSVRAVARLVGGSIDLLLRQLDPLLDSDASSREREAVSAALDGVLGHHLAASANPLAILMQLRRAGTLLQRKRPPTSPSIHADLRCDPRSLATGAQDVEQGGGVVEADRGVAIGE